MKLDFYSLFELAQLKAINSALEPSLESIYRMKCREYSVKYHTALHLVYGLNPMDVLQALYEEQYPPSIVEEECEELLDRLYSMKDPSYSRMTQEETEELVDQVLNKELARAKKKKPITQETIQSEIKADAIKPKSGSMSFGDLEKQDAATESNKSGFES